MNREELDYKIALDNFAGPMDLLLHLIRKEEVDIHDIPIGRVLDQYMAYLELMEAVDLDAAGDFAVMASTLMVIKSKMLLPVEEVDLEEELDPRFELVQQLLEYKRLRERSRLLEQKAEIVRHRLNRPDSARPEARIEEDRTLDDLSIWDIVGFFKKVMSETTISARQDRVIRGTQVPVREYAARLEERVRAAPVLLSELLKSAAGREDLVGYFLAILLLIKTQSIEAQQTEDFGDIRLVARVEEADAAERAAQELELADDFRD